jgi:SAM-dependent methyltransferase
MSSAQPGSGNAERDRAVQHRRESLEQWEEAASGWRARQAAMRSLSEPVSQWMVQAISPQPGQRVLELAAGLGETGFRVAELVAPAGGVITSDQSEAMLEGARARASELGLSNVEFQVLNAEWIDLPVASVDAVLCRWGYMLMADPGAALRETRRVLRPGGRLALAVWGQAQENPWAMLPASELRERGLLAPPRPEEPGPFALGDARLVRGLLEQSGFEEVEVQALDLEQRAASFQDVWDTTLDLSRSFHDAVLSRPQAEIAQIRDSLERRFAPYTAPDGSVSVPMRTLVAAASA